LQSYLSEYFLVAVRLCHQLLRLTNKSISMLQQWKSFFSDPSMTTYQSDFDLWANLIRDEVNLLIAQKVDEQSSNVKSLLKFSTAGESFRKRLKTRLRILDSCSKYDHQTTWKEIRKVGNSTLFNQTREYQDWKIQTASSTLICTGKLGSGKSVLLANIVDDLNLHVQNKTIPVAYFFCRHDIPSSLKARTVIGSLARQLLGTFTDWLKDGSNDTATPALSIEEILALLHDTVPSSGTVYFVIDGLDECDDFERQSLVQQLRKLQKGLVLLVCLSFRLEAKNISRINVEQFAGHMTMMMPNDNPDIAEYIDAELERCIESGKLMLGNPALILKIQAALLEGAQGMFLWVVLQIESLCEAESDEAIHRALEDLPKDLPGWYSGFYLPI
jgi:Cdc6-like AAA superfamily ATPase